MRSYPAHEVAKRRLQYGDLVMATSGGSGVLAVGAVVLFASSECALPTNFAARLVPRDDVDPKYLVYLHYALNKTGITNALTKKVTIANLDTAAYLQTHAPLPPAHEQALIVRFLDHAGRRIGRCTSAKQKLIKMLEEHKRVLIHRAVTRGLDLTARLKPSGVEWLGDVPDHWEVARAGTVCSFHSAKAHEQFVTPDGEHICVTARFVSTGGHSFRRCTKNFSPAQRGDVLMVMSDLPRGRALARAYIVDDDRSYAVNQRVCILRPFQIHPQFLAFSANRHPELLAQDDGFNQTHLPNAAFKIMRLPLPPLEEQAAIAEFLTRKCAALDSAVLSTKREIALLGEYRTRLIADVVTGKLDVREAAARLPNKAEEQDPRDDIDAEEEFEEADVDDTEDASVEAEP
jgi:type I restriction enzyme S subunit